MSTRNIILLVTFATLLFSCADKKNKGNDTDSLCSEGDTQICVCDDSETSTQVCNILDTEWSQCDCALSDSTVIQSSDSESDTLTRSDTDTHVATDSQSIGDTETHVEIQTDTHSDTGVNIDTNTNMDTGMGTETLVDTNISTETINGSDSNSSVESDSNELPATDTQTDTHTSSAQDTDTISDTNSEEESDSIEETSDGSDTLTQCNGCFIDNVCYANGVVNPNNACQLCLVGSSQNRWQPNDGASCDDDGEFCNGKETCRGSVCTSGGPPCNALEKCREDIDECCISNVYFACGPDGDVHEYDSCDVAGRVVQDCHDTNGRCTNATCGCLEDKYGEYCSTCRIFVDGENGSDEQDGREWETAVKTIEQGMLLAVKDKEKCVVWVKKGTYIPKEIDDKSTPEGREQNRTSTFQLRENIELFGGFAGTENKASERLLDGSTATVLSGNIGLTGDPDDNSYHVVTGANGAVLDGFTILHGNADGEGSNSKGAGLYTEFSMTVRNSRFEKNEAVEGGGVYAGADIALVFENTEFFRNDAEKGGGVYLSGLGSGDLLNRFSYCTFDANRSRFGSGIYLEEGSGAEVADSDIYGTNSEDTNSTPIKFEQEKGGGIYAEKQTRLYLISVILSQNAVTLEGGGLYAEEPESLKVKYCTFEDNESAARGGGMYVNDKGSPFLVEDISILSSEFIGNKAVVGGGLMVIESGLDLFRTYFDGNMATEADAGSIGGGGALDLLDVKGNIDDCEFTGNKSADGLGVGQVSGSLWIRNTDIFGNEGGLKVNSDAIQLIGVSFTNNHSKAALVNSGMTNINKLTFKQNHIALRDEVGANVIETTFFKNTYAVTALGNTTHIERCTFLNNCRVFEAIQDQELIAGNIEVLDSSITGSYCNMDLSLFENASLTFDNVVYAGNATTEGNSLISISRAENLSFKNSLIVGNIGTTPLLSIDSVSEDDDTVLLVQNSTIVDNETGVFDLPSSGLTYNIFNSIIWNNGLASGINWLTGCEGDCDSDSGSDSDLDTEASTDDTDTPSASECTEICHGNVEYSHIMGGNDSDSNVEGKIAPLYEVDDISFNSISKSSEWKGTEFKSNTLETELTAIDGFLFPDVAGFYIQPDIGDPRTYPIIAVTNEKKSIVVAGDLMYTGKDSEPKDFTGATFKIVSYRPIMESSTVNSGNVETALQYDIEGKERFWPDRGAFEFGSTNNVKEHPRNNHPACGEAKFDENTQTWRWFCNDKKSFEAAAESCRQIHTSTHLADVASSFEQEYITSIVPANFHVWLWATDTESEGKWEWQSGLAWSYENWQFTNVAHEDNDCLVMIHTSGYWLDIPCGSQNQYVCEYTP